MTTPMKRCTKCGEPYPATTEYFYKQKGGKYGVRGACIKCTNKAEKDYRETDPQKAKDRCRRYYIENKDAINAKHADYRRRNPEKAIARQRRWHEQNPTKYSEYGKRYRSKHPERNRQIGLNWRLRNPDKVRARQQRYNFLNPQVQAAARARREARVRSLPNTFTSNDWVRALEYWNNRCAVCERPQGLWHVLAADHWIPISLPTCPGTVPNNIVPLCHGEGGCNNSKHNKMPTEWLVMKFGDKQAKAIAAKIQKYFDWLKT